MRVHIATDHAGLELKDFLVKQLTKEGYEMIDHGAHVYDAVDDYPDFVIPAAEAVAEEFPTTGSLGIVIGGSGNGEQIAANKVKGIRCALALSKDFAALARQHNNANIVSLSGRFTKIEESLEIAKVFLTTKFPGDERHARRIKKMAEYEEKTKK